MASTLEAIYSAARERSPEQSISVFHRTYTSFEELLKTFIFFDSKTKTLLPTTTPLTFRTNTTMLSFAKHGSYNRTPFNLATLDQETLLGRFATGVEFVLNYNFVAEKSHTEYESHDIKERFMSHYSATKDLLLVGPPGANSHNVNPGLAAEWIAAQKTPERRRLAQLVVDKLRYISHTEMLEGIQNCVAQLEAQYNPDLPVILIVGSPKKSNYYTSLLFAHFWLERGKTIDYVLPGLYKAKTLHLAGNVIDIDDMGYSGSQTVSTLDSLYRSILDVCVSVLKDKIIDPAILSFMPAFLVEYILGQIGFQYYLVRIYSSSYSINKWKELSNLPMRLITHEIIPTLVEQVGARDAAKINALFNTEDAIMTVYFDHKIADSVSTLLVPIATGVVPGRPLMDNYNRNTNISSENRAAIAGNDAEPTFLPFINNCSREITVDDLSEIDGDDSLRCPYAWYKKINYAKGTYTPPMRGGLRLTRRRQPGLRLTRRRQPGLRLTRRRQPGLRLTWRGPKGLLARKKRLTQRRMLLTRRH